VVCVYRGEFDGSEHTDAFNVYDMSTVVFGAAAGTYDFATEYLNAIKMVGRGSSIAANKITFNGTQENLRFTFVTEITTVPTTKHKKEDGDFSPSLFYANKISGVKGSIREGAVERM
jgi:hypothetical protein